MIPGCCLQEIEAQVHIPELKETANLRRYGATHAIHGEVELSQVGEVAYGRGNGAMEAQVGEVQRHNTATAAPPRAARHTVPLAQRLVAAP